HRNAKRPGQVRRRVADRYHQIERRDLRRELVKIDQWIALGKIMDMPAELPACRCDFVTALSVLKVDEFDPRHGKDGRPLGKSDRALPALVRLSSGLPGNANLEASFQYQESLAPL